jgi:hypothetical protein
MSTDPETLVLDGNAIAGLLADVFGGAEMTTSIRACATCGEHHPIGAYRLYRGPGYVLRCPSCSDVALTLVASDDHRSVTITGTWSIRTTAV